MSVQYFIHDIMFHDSGGISEKRDLPKYSTKYQRTRTTKQTFSGISESSKKSQSQFVFTTFREILIDSTNMNTQIFFGGVQCHRCNSEWVNLVMFSRICALQIPCWNANT